MPHIYLYTGNGAGKTTNALGLVVRALGHGQKVYMIQLLKWDKNIGEYEFQWIRGISDFTLVQYGREGWHGFKNITDEDRINCLKALKVTCEVCKTNKIDLLILDEINLAVYLGLLHIYEVKEFLNNIPAKINIVMTGRHAPKELCDLADFVNEIVEVKAPKEPVCERGIQY